MEACTNREPAGNPAHSWRAEGRRRGSTPRLNTARPAQGTGDGAQGTAHNRVQIHASEGGTGAFRAHSKAAQSEPTLRGSSGHRTMVPRSSAPPGAAAGRATRHAAPRAGVCARCQQLQISTPPLLLSHAVVDHGLADAPLHDPSRRHPDDLLAVGGGRTDPARRVRPAQLADGTIVRPHVSSISSSAAFSGSVIVSRQ